MRKICLQTHYLSIYNNSHLHVVEPTRERYLIRKIGVNSSIQDQRQADQGFYGVESVVCGNADSSLNWAADHQTRLWPTTSTVSDVHPSPGRSRYPCSVFKNVTSQGTSYTCTRCTHWVHSTCACLRNDADYRKANGWICTTCMTPPQPHAHSIRQPCQTFNIL